MDSETHGGFNRDLEVLSLSPASPALAHLFPIRGKLCKRLKALDRCEYWLVRLDQPLRSLPVKAAPEQVGYLVLWPDEENLANIKSNRVFRTGIDIVLEDNLLDDEYIVFGKCEAIGVGSAMLMDEASAN